jgi:hypothetical protein
VTQLGQQNGNLNLEPSCEDQKCPIFLQSHTSIPANLDSSDRKQSRIDGVRKDAAHQTADVIERAPDFGILKWSTSAVCFGPPWAQQTSTLDLSVSLDLEAGVGLESQGGAIRADSVGI